MMSECAFSETDVSTALVVSFAVLDEFVPLLHAASEASRNAASVSVNAFLFIITPPGIFWGIETSPLYTVLIILIKLLNNIYNFIKAFFFYFLITLSSILHFSFIKTIIEYPVFQTI